jgi:hypothetical protein
MTLFPLGVSGCFHPTPTDFASPRFVRAQDFQGVFVVRLIN